MTDVEDMSLLEQVSHIKATISCHDVAEMADLEVVADKIRSPWNPDERTPSCHLYSDHFYDFAKGEGGDVIDLAMLVTGKSWGSVVNLLAKAGQRLEADPDRVKRSVKPEPSDMAAQFELMRDTDEPGVSYWSTAFAGVHPEWMDRLFSDGTVGQDVHTGALLVPHRHEGQIHGIKTRSRTSGQKAAVPGSIFSTGLYSTGYTEGKEDVAIITEGESDCWALDSYFWRKGGEWPDVYALPGGAALWRDEWLEQLKGYRVVYTAFDNDHAGDAATNKVRRAIGWGRWNQLEVPQLIKDVREALSRGWEPKP
jgi:hypothetical protein